MESCSTSSYTTAESPENGVLGNLQKSGHKTTERRLDFVMRLDEVTGKPIAVAWKNFGYKGPKFHDGFLYGEPNSTLEMTGTLCIA